MIRTKARSPKIVGAMPSNLFPVVTDKQLCTCEFHAKRSYECVINKTREPKRFKTGHSPARQLSPDHVNTELQVIYGKIKGKS
jgi:hypothetical protein